MELQASNYHDLRALAELRHRAGEAPQEAIEPVARQFESLLLQMMLKSMRSTVSEGGLLKDDSVKFYQDMMDSQLALTLSEQGGIGLAGTIAAQLAPAPAAVATGEMPAAGEALRLSLAAMRQNGSRQVSD